MLILPFSDLNQKNVSKTARLHLQYQSRYRGNVLVGFAAVLALSPLS